MACFLGFVDDAGVFALDNKVGFRAYIQKWKGQEIVVSVKRRPSNSTAKQFRYYRGIVIPDLALACGYVDPDEHESIHDAMAFKFLRLPDDQFGTPKRRSTSRDDLTREELATYIDQIIMWAETSIPGCHIRRPDEVDDMDRVVDQEWQ
jgi:hypothetical protein